MVTQGDHWRVLITEERQSSAHYQITISSFSHMLSGVRHLDFTAMLEITTYRLMCRLVPYLPIKLYGMNNLLRWCTSEPLGIVYWYHLYTALVHHLFRPLVRHWHFPDTQTISINGTSSTLVSRRPVVAIFGMRWEHIGVHWRAYWWINIHV